MGAIYAIFAFFLIGGFCTIALVLTILFFIGRRKRSRLLRWVGAIAAAGCLILAALVYFLWFVHPYADTDDKKAIHDAFVSNFGFDPGRDFVPINQRFNAMYDTSTLYSQFKASPETFEKICAGGFEPTSTSEFFRMTGGQYQPPWWTNYNISSNVFYANHNWKGFGGDWAYLSYTPGSNIVYVCILGH